MTAAARAPRGPSVLTTGVLLVALSLLVRPGVVGYHLTPDGHLSGTGKIAVVLAAEAVALLLGLLALVRGRVPFLSAWLVRPVNAVLALALFVALYANLTALRILDPLRETRERVAVMVESEELLLGLTPKLKKLSGSAKNLALPDHVSRELFEPMVTTIDLEDAPPSTERTSDLALALETRHWSVAATRARMSADELELWSPLLAEVRYFEHAKFYFHHGDFLTEDRDVWASDLRFAGTARLVSGELAGVHAKARVVWVDTGEVDAEDEAVWRIANWETVLAEAEAVPARLFEEVLDRALPDADDLTRARRSIHEELVLAYFLAEAAGEELELPYPDFQLPSFDRHPGVSVADVDGDGDDDVYVMARHGRNQLFRNRGDGTFEDAAAELGIDVDGNSSAALFADFDNDGDANLFLGRTRAASRYFENAGGRFVDRSEEWVGGPLPHLVSSLAAADFDGDGLLDLYVSTYASRALREDLGNSDSREAEMLLRAHLPEEDSRELFRLATGETYHRILTRPGPPNVLYRNAGGGRLERVADQPELAVWKNTFQSSFGDYDRDGDADLYVANDFSENVLFENDGTGRFTDVTARERVADIGFGMGADWADFDNDGEDDLYVSNMYSKAGQRITRQVPGLNPRFAEMARGNTLFRNAEGFDRVSAQEEPGLLVEIAGWSWGGQFADFDNDGWQDIYALSGFYTVPDAVALPLDL